jgi:DNA polymerase III epsilon subunit
MIHVVLDLETTGLDPQLEGILEIAAVRLEDGRPVGVFHQLTRPDVEISEASQAIHGISAEMVADAPTPAEALAPLLAFLGDAPLVAHNAPFDLQFLNRALALAGRPALTNPVFDTLEMARELFPEQRSYKLEAICKLLGHEASGFHRALADAEHLAAVFPTMLRLWEQKQAWYRDQFGRIEAVARRYDQVSHLIDALQAELSDQRRILSHYFQEHPEASVQLPGGEALAWASKEQWDYDLAALRPLLAAWGLGDKFLKLDRPRLERWMGGARLTEEQKQQVAATRILVGHHHRVTRVAPGAGLPGRDVLE